MLSITQQRLRKSFLKTKYVFATISIQEKQKTHTFF